MYTIKEIKYNRYKCAYKNDKWTVCSRQRFTDSSLILLAS